MDTTVQECVNLPGETWCPVIGYEGHYEVSSTGKVRSLHVVFVSMDKHKHKMVHLKVYGKTKTMLLHRIVALAFYGPRPDRMVIRHLDSNIWNNKASNLAYGTQKANIADEIVRGTFGGKAAAPAPVELPLDEAHEEWRAALPGIEASSEGRVRLVRMIDTERIGDGYFTLADEEWRPVVGYEGLYDVSNYGHVRSYYIEHLRGKIATTPQSVCSMHACKQRGMEFGYSRVALCKGGKRSCRRVHTLVARAFLGDGPKGFVVRHLDGNSRNNHVSNLAWGTVKDNAQDTARYGRASKKLTEQNVVEMRRRYAAGETASVLAKDFGVNPASARWTIRGQLWKHLSGAVPRSIRHFRHVTEEERALLAAKQKGVPLSEERRANVSAGLCKGWAKRRALRIAGAQAKLSWDKVDQIHIHLASGMKIRDIAALFGVDASTISSIKIGRAWKYAG